MKSVCDYLASPSTNIYIYQNAAGCNNDEEVHEACDEAGVNEIPVVNELKIYPNPFIQTTTFKFELMEPAIIEIKIYNHLGVEIYKFREYQYKGYQEINWKVAKAMRDIISHHYFEIDAEIIFEVCQNKIIPLRDTIKKILDSL